MTAYYNEIDPFAAQWLRELITQGHIADGIVDERSIEDVTPEELRPYTQCHFFAGIGVWSYALRQAGWPDDRPIWTGSCPCQPFSSAGKGGGFNDERHLWPAFYWLIDQCRPDLVLGEQVAGKAGEVWFDAVRTDLEGSGYASGLSVFPACGVGAPHQRKRLYWVGVGPLGNAQGIGHLQRVVGNQASQECPPFGRGAQPGQGSGRHDAANAGEPICMEKSSKGRAWDHDSATCKCGRHSVERESESLRQGHGASSSDGSFSAGPACSLDNAAGARHIGPILGAEGDPRDETRLRLPGARCGLGGLADAPGRERRRRASDGTSIVNGTQAERDQVQRDATGCGAVRGLADAEGERSGAGSRCPQQAGDTRIGRTVDCDSGEPCSLADASGEGLPPCERGKLPAADGNDQGRAVEQCSVPLAEREPIPGPTNGFWGVADWLGCRDGKWRPVEPGTFPLVDGAAARVGRLRGYGNAIVAQQAQAFIEAVMEGTP